MTSAGVVSAPASRLRLRVGGTVQGVGFRPFVHRLAGELELSGWVLNDERGVLIEVEGAVPAVEALQARLASDAPPLAMVESVEAQPCPPTGERGFRIVESARGGEPQALVSPDHAPCADCIRELLDPGDRRHRYPFINCTNCGPRFSIVTGVPYDRPQTTMAGFAMCARCRDEYEDQDDRRYHAQPIACPDCGPAVALVDASGHPVEVRGTADPVAATARLLGEGAIVAVKGVGGYHLACLAHDERAVGALRARKHRESKPFALLARDLEAAAELTELGAIEEELLGGRRRPIVIARRRPGAAVAAAVAPLSPDLGVMLAPSPLHELLARDVGAALVMTSGNLSDEPIAYRDEDALERLAGIADAFCVHDRPISARTDDSVLRSLDPRLREAPLLIRRSRGFAPESLRLPVAARRPLLGCGAELKSTFCVAKGARAWVGPHIGDLKNWETLESYREGVARLETLFAVEPAVIAHDLHPDYLSTRFALEHEGLERVAVQHHHAHLAACLAEHAETGRAVGLIYDGAGLGPDGTVWGGEILVGDLIGYERAGLLFPVRLPGGDAAARQPWRMACAWLAAALGDPVPPIPASLREQVTGRDWAAVCELVASGLNSPLTTSAGRLFDAVAAICGIGAEVDYEGQAAAELEGIASLAELGRYPMPLAGNDADAGAPGQGLAILDPRETISALLADLAAGVPVAIVSARFHNALAAASAAACVREARRRDLSVAVLSGGVFQNRLLVERTAAAITREGIRVLIPARLPPNDGGISFGQVAVAAAREQG